MTKLHWYHRGGHSWRQVIRSTERWRRLAAVRRMTVGGQYRVSQLTSGRDVDDRSQ